MTVTVTVAATDINPDGTVPRLGFVTFSRATVDGSGNIVPTDPVSVLVTATTQPVTLDAGTVYRVRGDGIPGFTTFYASTASDTTLTAFRGTYQIDPTTLQPVTTVPTVAAEIAALQAQIAALPTGGGGGLSVVDNGDGTLSSTSSSIVDNGDGTLSA